MPKTQKSLSLGNAAADAFLLLDDASVGRVVRALVYFAFHGETPAIPKPLRATFYAVYAEDCRIRGVKPVRPQSIKFADSPEAAQAEISEISEISEMGEIGAEENRIEENRIDTPSSEGVVREAHPAPAPAREPWEPCEACPLEEDIVRSEARRVGLDEKELENWRDYWTMREWRSDPRSARPMTRAGVKSSIRRWATEKGVREAREAHLDAKADERHAAALSARDNRGPAPTDYAALEAAKRRAEAESPCVIGFDENGLAILGKKGMQP